MDTPLSPHASEAADTMELPSPSPLTSRHARYSEHLTVSSDVTSPVSENRRRGMSMHDVGLPRKRLSFAKGVGVESLVKTTRCVARLCVVSTWMLS